MSDNNRSTPQRTGLARLLPHRKRYEADIKDATVVEESALKRAVVGAGLGNTVEWYDFGIYAYSASIISQVFFPPNSSQAVRLIATFAAFTAAFLIRPVGGLILGPLGDKIGRQRVLSATIIMMAAGTLGIGLIPSYATIGVLAPVLLLVCRLIQGFSTGGEYGGATTFIAEHSPDRRRGFMGSWLEFGTLGGFVLGASTYTLLAGVLTPEQLLSWGWRIPFLLAGPLGIIGLYMRLKLHETPVYQEHKKQRDEQEQQGFWRAFAQHWRAVLICMGLVLVFNVTDGMLLAYMPTFLTERRGLSYEHGLLLLIVVMLIMMITITFGGRLSDYFGRRPMLFAGCIGFLVLSWPAVQLIRAPSSWLVFAGLLLLGLTLVTFTSTMPATLPAMFPAGIRYGSVSIAFNISVSLFAGTVPLVAQSLISATGDDNIVAYYLMGAAAIGLVAVYFTKETAQQPMPESSPTITKEEKEQWGQQGEMVEDRKPEQRT